MSKIVVSLDDLESPHILDNPIYHSLVSIHSSFNLGDENVAFFPPDMMPMVGAPQWDRDMQPAILSSLPKDADYFIVLHRERISFEPLLAETSFEGIGVQMVCFDVAPFDFSGFSIQALDSTHVPAMLALTKLTEPGPFVKNTINFGSFVGILKDGDLLAMGGERLQLSCDDKKFSEVTSICVHPEYQRKGYGRAIITHICNRIKQRGDIPFLHCRQSKTGAIAMYEKVGFKKRCDVHVAAFQIK